MKIFYTATIALFSTSCATKSKSTEPKRIDGLCRYDQDPTVSKVTNYEGMPESTVSAYSQSCTDQSGEWTANFSFIPPAGTKGCLLAPAGGGPKITTWYTGTSYVTTTIDCADLIPVSM